MSPVGKTKDAGWEIGVSRTDGTTGEVRSYRELQRDHWAGVLDRLCALLV